MTSGNPEERLLIRLVKEREILYMPQYNNFYASHNVKMLRDLTWAEIAKTMGISKIRCQIKWNKIVSNYRMALRAKLPFPDNKTSPPKFEHEKEMRFLRPYLKFHRTVFNSNKKLLPKLKNNPSLAIPSTSNTIQIDSDNDTIDQAHDTIVIDENSNSSDATTIDSVGGEDLPNKKESCTNVDDIEQPTPEVVHDGELIIELGGETLRIPASINVNDDGIPENSVQVSIKPISECLESGCPVEVDILENNDRSSEEKEILKAFDDIFNEVDIEKELGIDIVPSTNRSLVENILKYICQDKFLPRKKECSCTLDQDSEEYFYQSLGKAAKQINNYSQRLRLRSELSKCVENAVKFYNSGT